MGMDYKKYQRWEKELGINLLPSFSWRKCPRGHVYFAANGCPICQIMHGGDGRNE